ncbi:MAG: hypothetical protein M3169_04775 [Candidatus Eremiobacteraeota bacterium]|nr:hypothetical protein [Candidatus Eremiobacteraeota bacterium]
MDRVKWYKKLDTAKTVMLVNMSTLSITLLGRLWHNEVVVWMGPTFFLVAYLVLLIAWVRRVRES